MRTITSIVLLLSASLAHAQPEPGVIEQDEGLMVLSRTNAEQLSAAADAIIIATYQHSTGRVDATGSPSTTSWFQVDEILRPHASLPAAGDLISVSMGGGAVTDAPPYRLVRLSRSSRQLVSGHRYFLYLGWDSRRPAKEFYLSLALFGVYDLTSCKGSAVEPRVLTLNEQAASMQPGELEAALRATVDPRHGTLTRGDCAAIVSARPATVSSLESPQDPEPGVTLSESGDVVTGDSLEQFAADADAMVVVTYQHSTAYLDSKDSPRTIGHFRLDEILKSDPHLPALGQTLDVAISGRITTTPPTKRVRLAYSSRRFFPDHRFVLYLRLSAEPGSTTYALLGGLFGAFDVTSSKGVPLEGHGMKITEEVAAAMQPGELEAALRASVYTQLKRSHYEYPPPPARPLPPELAGAPVRP